MTSIDTDLCLAADELDHALVHRRPIEPLSQRYNGFDVAAAYAVQRHNLARRLAGGAHIRGHKIGLTSKPMQDLLGVNEPDFGYILDQMIVADGASISSDDFCAPRVEPEVAFLLNAPLAGPGVTAADVMAATEAVAPALEIVDSRIVDWRITLPDTVADNASSAAVVLGPWVSLDEAGDLAATEATLVVNDELVATGTGAAVLGHPAEAVAWLANALAAYDTSIDAGQFIMSGSFTAATFVHKGDCAAADLVGLGRVSLTFE